MWTRLLNFKLSRSERYLITYSIHGKNGCLWDLSTRKCLPRLNFFSREDVRLGVFFVDGSNNEKDGHQEEDIAICARNKIAIWSCKTGKLKQSYTASETTEGPPLRMFGFAQLNQNKILYFTKSSLILLDLPTGNKTDLNHMLPSDASLDAAYDRCELKLVIWDARWIVVYYFDPTLSPGEAHFYVFDSSDQEEIDDDGTLGFPQASFHRIPNVKYSSIWPLASSSEDNKTLRLIARRQNPEAKVDVICFDPSVERFHPSIVVLELSSEEKTDVGAVDGKFWHVQGGGPPFWFFPEYDVYDEDDSEYDSDNEIDPPTNLIPYDLATGRRNSAGSYFWHCQLGDGVVASAILSRNHHELLVGIRSLSRRHPAVVAYLSQEPSLEDSNQYCGGYKRLTPLLLVAKTSRSNTTRGMSTTQATASSTTRMRITTVTTNLASFGTCLPTICLCKSCTLQNK